MQILRLEVGKTHSIKIYKMKLTQEFREKARIALLTSRKNYSGSDTAFAKTFDISASVFSRIKNGETEGVLSDAKWLTIGREYNVTLKKNLWNIARTEVYEQIQSNLDFCKEYSKAMILVDQWGIGKTECSKHLIKQMNDAFYLDCSQAKTKREFIRALAKVIGLDNRGKYVEIKSNLKYYINQLNNPLIVLDDAGDLEYPAFLELKELWNATEDSCGWYMIGDDSLQAKITKGLEKQKVGYGAIFSRYSDGFISLVPIDKKSKQNFFIKLIGDVATVNVKVKTQVPKLVKRCVGKEKTLRHLKTLIQMNA